MLFMSIVQEKSNITKEETKCVSTKILNHRYVSILLVVVNFIVCMASICLKLNKLKERCT